MFAPGDNWVNVLILKQDGNVSPLPMQSSHQYISLFSNQFGIEAIIPICEKPVTAFNGNDYCSIFYTPVNRAAEIRTWVDWDDDGSRKQTVSSLGTRLATPRFKDEWKLCFCREPSCWASEGS